MTWAQFLFGSVPCSHWSVHTGLLEKLLTAWGDAATIPYWSEGLWGGFSFSFYVNDKQFCKRVGGVTQQLSCRSLPSDREINTEPCLIIAHHLVVHLSPVESCFSPVFLLPPLALPVHFAILWPVLFCFFHMLTLPQPSSSLTAVADLFSGLLWVSLTLLDKNSNVFFSEKLIFILDFLFQLQKAI